MVVAASLAGYPQHTTSLGSKSILVTYNPPKQAGGHAVCVPREAPLPTHQGCGWDAA